VYVRLGIRVLYKGWRNKMEGGRGESCFWMSIIELIL
jgi:hypothetical protein